MKGTLKQALGSWLGSPTWSPAGFLVRAAALCLLHAGLTLCGLERYVSVLSLTVPDGVPRSVAGVFCMAYLFSHFAFLLAVPILVIGAACFALALRFLGRGGTSRE